MSFDWPRFLSQHRVEFFEAGANVARGNINIRCPWCGSSDESGHLGISLNGKGWGCWRNERHRGRAPERLVSALLRVSWAEAHELVEGGAGARPMLLAEGFGDAIGKMLGMGPWDVMEPSRLDPLAWPRSIRQLSRAEPGSYAYYDYLFDRGYTAREADGIISTYGLRFATTGAYQGRIIIPVETRDEGLASWTGRHVGKHPVRYRSLSPDPTKAAADFMPVARKPINHCIFNQAELETLDQRWPLLMIGEGPFDAINLDYFARHLGMRGSCLFGLAVHQCQLSVLADIVDRFDRKVLLLDEDATIAAMTTAEKVRPFGFSIRTTHGKKDPGSMLPREIEALAKEALAA